MPDNKQLKERLRSSAVGMGDAGILPQEAADTIERLEAERREREEIAVEREAKLATLEAQRERDAAVLDGLTSDEGKETFCAALEGMSRWAWIEKRPKRHREEAVHAVGIGLEAALQHAQEQVGGTDGPAS